jgi:hypothetical protein
MAGAPPGGSGVAPWEKPRHVTNFRAAWHIPPSRIVINYVHMCHSAGDAITHKFSHKPFQLRSDGVQQVRLVFRAGIHVGTRLAGSDLGRLGR